jgi:hypothetical protein
MPRPTVAPLVLALGLALLAAGVPFGAAFVAVGAAFCVAGLSLWIAQLLPGQGHVLEPLAEEERRPAPATGVAGGVEQMREGMPGYRFRLPQQVHPLSAGIKGGIAGGLAMPVPALLWGVLSRNGLLYPVNLLAGMVVPGVADMDLGQFYPSLFIVAVVIHIALSLVFGLILGVLLPTLPAVPRPIAWGGLLMPLVWTGVSYLAMRLVNPALPEAVNWPWFIVSQFVYGITMPAVVLGAKRLPPLLAGVLGGLIGGGAMAVPALLWATASRHGFWYPVNVLAGMLLPGPGAANATELGSFHAEWFVVAGALHAILSAGFGVLFALVARRLPPIPGPVCWGGLVLPLLWTGVCYSLMGVVNRVLQERVDWPWFIVSQFAFGVIAAWVVHRSEMVHIPPAGPGPERLDEFVAGEQGGTS